MDTGGPKVFVRLPYAERFHAAGYGSQATAYQSTVFEDIPEVPEGLLQAADSYQTAADRIELFTDEAGSPMNGYAYGSTAREWLLTQRKAASRISQSHPDLYASLVAKDTIRRVTKTTPLIDAGSLFGLGEGSLALKLENWQYQNSFKVRGAAFAVARLLEKLRPDGLAAASAGNHAQGVALAAAHHDLEAVLYMPTTTPDVKQDAVRELGAKVELVGHSYTDAALACSRALLGNSGLYEVHPFNDADVITGQGTIAAELLGQNPALRRVFVGAGGGGAAVGIGKTLKSYDPSIEVVAVQLEGSEAFKKSRAAGKLVTLKEVNLRSDGTAVRRIGQLTLAGSQQYVDRVVTVSYEQLESAMISYHRFAKTELGKNDHLEPAGALALAAYAQEFSGDNGLSVAVCTGGNISSALKQRIVELAA